MSATALGALPALPLHTAGKYVAGAYIVAFALVLVYVAIMAMRLGKIERELGELVELTARERTGSGEGTDGAGEEHARLGVEEREGSPV
jgi:CcmD family protein